MRINSCSSVRCHSDWKLLCISSSESKEKGIWTSNVEMLSFLDFYLEILSIPTFQWVEGNDKAVNHHFNSENSKIPTVPQDMTAGRRAFHFLSETVNVFWSTRPPNFSFRTSGCLFFVFFLLSFNHYKVSQKYFPCCILLCLHRYTKITG